jgi:hypothetical protein
VVRTDDNVWADPWGGQYEIRDNGFVLPVPMAIEAAPLEALLAEGKLTGQSPILALDDLAGSTNAQLAPEPNFTVGGRGVAVEFSIFDWSDYPVASNVPRPTGPFSLRTGEDYLRNRAVADTTNDALRAANRQVLRNFDIHEIQPVEFGGSPTDFSNKYVLPRPDHRLYTTWWNRLQGFLTGR